MSKPTNEDILSTMFAAWKNYKSTGDVAELNMAQELANNLDPEFINNSEFKEFINKLIHGNIKVPNVEDVAINQFFNLWKKLRNYKPTIKNWVEFDNQVNQFKALAHDLLTQYPNSTYANFWKRCELATPTLKWGIQLPKDF